MPAPARTRTRPPGSHAAHAALAGPAAEPAAPAAFRGPAWSCLQPPRREPASSAAHRAAVPHRHTCHAMIYGCGQTHARNIQVQMDVAILRLLIGEQRACMQHL